MNNINSIGQLNNISGIPTKSDIKSSNSLKDNISISFKDVFAGKISNNAMLEDMKLSKHAVERINSRNINFTEKELQNLGDAIKKAEDKGSKESLILMDNIALIVSVRNKTVITAMTGESMRENVVTNIDSTIII